MERLHVCRKLSEAELIHIYSRIAVRHFPEAELKPVENVRNYLKNGLYMGYGLFEETTLLAYALFLAAPAGKKGLPGKLLLDYYAVLEEYRNAGIGSEFLQALKMEPLFAKGIYIESENPDFAGSEDEKQIREKRIDFYDRNGAVFTGVLSTLFGVPYRILYLPLSEKPGPAAAVPEKTDFYEEIDFIYRTMFPPAVYAAKAELKKGNVRP